MAKKTPLYESHIAANAKIVDFAGWDMPLHYGSQVQEHRYVREEAGMFDVSHMTVVDITGQSVKPFLRMLLANNVDRLIDGKALYSCMLNERGGVIDDLIVYQINQNSFRLVVNSATRQKDLNWIKKHAYEDLTIRERNDFAMIALQGPLVRTKIPQIFPEHHEAVLALKPFHAIQLDDFFIARTGYTGEDGFEIILPATHAEMFWKKLLAQNIHPCGLGARDTLRLEAGLNLYGSDMDESVTPFESNLGWTVALEPKDRNFIGREALEKQLAQGLKHQLYGLVLKSQGVLRNHQKVQVENIGEGEITSGSFSVTLNKGVALARLPVGNYTECTVQIRDNRFAQADIVKPPFVKRK